MQNKKIFRFVIFFLSLTFIFFHAGKAIFFKGNFYNMEIARENVYKHITKDDHLIFFDEIFYGSFIEFFHQDTDLTPNRALMLFPFAEQGPSKRQKESAINFLNNELPSMLSAGALIGLNKIKHSAKINNNTLEFRHMLGEVLTFKIKEVIYEDSKYIIFRTSPSLKVSQ